MQHDDRANLSVWLSVVMTTIGQQSRILNANERVGGAV